MISLNCLLLNTFFISNYVIIEKSNSSESSTELDLEKSSSLSENNKLQQNLYPQVGAGGDMPNKPFNEEKISLQENNDALKKLLNETINYNINNVNFICIH